MSSGYPLYRRPNNCYKGAFYKKYRVFINLNQVEQLKQTNYVFVNNFIRTQYHEPVEGYLEFSYVTSSGSITIAAFKSLLFSMGISDYIIPEQHFHSKYWNL